MRIAEIDELNAHPEARNIATPEIILPGILDADFEMRSWAEFMRKRENLGLDQAPAQRTEKSGKVLVESWRKSIVGLVKLADRNLERLQSPNKEWYYSMSAQWILSY